MGKVGIGHMFKNLKEWHASERAIIARTYGGSQEDSGFPMHREVNLAMFPHEERIREMAHIMQDVLYSALNILAAMAEEQCAQQS